MRLSREGTIELCKTIAAAIVCGGSAAAKVTHPIGAIEAILGATALAATVGTEPNLEVEKLLRKMAARVENESETWIDARDVGARGARAEAWPLVQQAIQQIAPTAREIVELGLDQTRIVNFYLDRASKIEGGAIFTDEPGNEIARELLGDIVGYTFNIIRSMPETQSHAEEALLDYAKRNEENIKRLERLIEGLNPDLLSNAEQHGLERATVIALARRLRPEDTLNFDQAIVELENAVRIALEVVADGERGSNLGEFVDDVLKRVAQATMADQPARAISEIEKALSELQTRDTDHRKHLLAAQTALIESAIKQEILRRDARAAALRVESLISLSEPQNLAAQSAARAARFRQYRQEGEFLGINISLEIATELARLMLRKARTNHERSEARNLLGASLQVLGERETTTKHLQESIITFRAALDEIAAQNFLPIWSLIQSNLANALATLGVRECNSGFLKEAVLASRLALKKRPRALVPLEWARIMSNLGNTLTELALLENSTVRLKEAIAVLNEALTVDVRTHNLYLWSAIQNNLGNALKLLGERERSIAWLAASVQAHREAIAGWVRDKFPLDWAMAQNNLSGALIALAESENGIAHLTEATIACREALKEWTYEKVPHQWGTAQNNLGVALMMIAERTHDKDFLKAGLSAFVEALKVHRADNSPIWHSRIRHNLARAEAQLS